MRRPFTDFSLLHAPPCAQWFARQPVLAGWVGTLISMSVFVLTLGMLATGRQQEIDRAVATSGNVAVTLSREVARNVELYDLSLQAVAEGAADERVKALPKDMRHRVLFDRSTAARYVSGVFVVDPTGHIVEGRDETAVHAYVGDRDYFLAHVSPSSPSRGLFISRPYNSRARGGAPSIALSRRISLSDGSFGGIASLAVNIDYFQAMMEALAVGPHGTALILETDGTVVARNPSLKSDEPKNVAHSRTFARMLAAKQGYYVADSPVDGVKRLYCFARVPDTNLIAVFAPSYDDLLAGWRRRSYVIGSLALLLSAAFACVVWALVFGLRYRIALQATISRLADIDPLTEVSNRRSLQRLLENAWRACQASGEPMSILFVDADHFKDYNDQHGHAAGDAALKIIAECLTRQTRANHDIVARYGGEEFVVVLPGAALADGVRAAEAIRDCVYQGSVRPSPEEMAPFTVSIGCSVILPTTAVTPMTGLLAADKALYAAKLRGRNRVSVATAPMYERAKDKRVQSTSAADLAC
ncbi:Diguanylate cyclase [Burkholderia sp. 8Y]|uniref:sensor domain-containing diguanylate cyclase n=1 Tax=Burkholderia sp. 8Y TaxID=2653133 RepID=UPI0012F1D4ED|nr:sensor domain-containing diguanylate cyclase [Burkholderia sp. 8Y]VXC18734.1 Diguanylate cyclase [Burkholderia sp. 8Y]